MKPDQGLYVPVRCGARIEPEPQPGINGHVGRARGGLGCRCPRMRETYQCRNLKHLGTVLAMLGIGFRARGWIKDSEMPQLAVPAKSVEPSTRSKMSRALYEQSKIEKRVSLIPNSNFRSQRASTSHVSSSLLVHLQVTLVQICRSHSCAFRGEDTCRVSRRVFIDTVRYGMVLGVIPVCSINKERK